MKLFLILSLLIFNSPAFAEMPDFCQLVPTTNTYHCSFTFGARGRRYIPEYFTVKASGATLQLALYSIYSECESKQFRFPTDRKDCSNSLMIKLISSISE